MKKEVMVRTISFITIICTVFTAATGICAITSLAEETKTEITVDGIRYTFDDKSKYEFDSAENSEKTRQDNSYGTFKISGYITDESTQNGFPSYGVNKENLQFSYSYDDSMLQAVEEQEHFIDDKSKKVNDITLETDILKGVLIVQTSKDGRIWYTVPNETETNIFASTHTSDEPFYTTTDTQLMNGCYYRIIFAYKTEQKIGTNKILFVNKDNTERKKYAEVYSFYAYDTTAAKVKVPEDNNRKKMGKLVRCTDYDSYGGEKDIDNEDPHSGWQIGSFFIGGYTDDDIDSDTEETVFLKNNGDRISLWFDLKEDINQCGGNPDIKVVGDAKGYDKGFDVPGGVGKTMDFGKGVLMIRQKYKDNQYSDPQIYTDFLEAGASPDAVTKVDLFEEGDYEVALDYAVKYDKTKLFGKTIAPQTNHYRVFFEFEVRNGNTVVFLKDTGNGSDLANGSITENGFSIDLANSQYLKVHVKREVLKDGFDGLVEDTKFNSSATNGDSFTKEGIYTITVSNRYNNESTEKRVYVGKDNLLKAYMVTGLTIAEIQDQLALGASIEDDGTIIPPEPEEGEVTEAEAVEPPASEASKEVSVSDSNSSDGESAETGETDTNVDEAGEDANAPGEPSLSNAVLVLIAVISIAIVLSAFIIMKKRRSSSDNEQNKEETVSDDTREEEK